MSTEPFRSHAIFASETALRTAFIKHLPHTWFAQIDCGFDILLVRKNDGAQIGVTVKLGLTDELMAKANPRTCGDTDGPDYEAVLIPWGTTGGHMAECDRYGVTVIEMRDREMYAYERSVSPVVKKFKPDLPQEGAVYWGFRQEWFHLAPINRLATPEKVS